MENELKNLEKLKAQLAKLPPDGRHSLSLNEATSMLGTRELASEELKRFADDCECIAFWAANSVVFWKLAPKPQGQVGGASVEL